MMRVLARWPWVLGTLAATVLTVSAFQGDAVLNPQAVSSLVLGAIGLAILGTVRAFVKKASTALDQFGEVMGALYGPKDGNGQRTNQGLVQKVDRISVMVERIPDLEDQVANVAVQAATAASAAQTAQQMAAAAAKAASGEQRDPRARTRAEDRDDG